jgi:hypothetical protein
MTLSFALGYCQEPFVQEEKKMSLVFRSRPRWFPWASVLVLSLIVSGLVFAQSTATIQGTVTDQNTGEERTTQTDASGSYLVSALPVGTYRVEIKAQGMQTMVATNLPIEVGSTARQDFSVKVATTSETVEITAAAPVIQENPVSVGTVVNQRTVQEIPLNGRHFVDLALLIPGTVTPPSSGFLTAPLRGQGSFAFNSAGGREDSINYMINGVNLSDPVQNQITFQPTINTIQEFKVDNQTFSAEYGRNSGVARRIVRLSAQQFF